MVEEKRLAVLDSFAEVPSVWAVRKLKHVAIAMNSNVDKKSFEDELPVRLCNYTDVYYHDVITAELPFMQATARADEIDHFRLLPGDSIITKDSESADDIGVPAFVGEDVEGVVCGYHLTLIRPSREVWPAYLAYVLRSWPSRAQFELGASGVTRFGLGKGAIDGLIGAYPDPQQQRVIAAFLDRETARIDALIEKKQRLIELLEEKRQAVITEAVTRGLDPDVPMKDSGVIWLGEIPDGWEFGKLKFFVPGVTVGIVVTPASYYVDDGVPCLRSLNVSSRRIDLTQVVYISEKSNALLAKSQIREGDIVVVRTGKTGGAAIVPRELHGANCIDLLIVRRSDRLLPEYLHLVLSADVTRQQVEAHSVGAIQAHYNTATLANLWIAAPAVAVQRRIVGKATARLERLDRLIARIGESVGLLQERRSTLITAAVTGQIEITEAA